MSVLYEAFTDLADAYADRAPFALLRRSDLQAEREAAASEAAKQLHESLFLESVQSGHDIDLMTASSKGKRYPVSCLLGESSMASQKKLLAACAEAMKPAEPSHANDATTARLLREFINAVAVEYANDFDVL